MAYLIHTVCLNLRWTTVCSSQMLLYTRLTCAFGCTKVYCGFPSDIHIGLWNHIAVLFNCAWLLNVGSDCFLLLWPAPVLTCVVGRSSLVWCHYYTRRVHLAVLRIKLLVYRFLSFGSINVLFSALLHFPHSHLLWCLADSLLVLDTTPDADTAEIQEEISEEERAASSIVHCMYTYGCCVPYRHCGTMTTHLMPRATASTTTATDSMLSIDTETVLKRYNKL